MTTRRQTDRLADHTYVNAAARATQTSASATNATTDVSESTRTDNNGSRNDRARRRARLHC